MSNDDARIAALEKRQAAFEKMNADAHARTAKQADEAKRRANDSLHEIESIAAGLVSHMARVEALRAAEAEEDKKQRAFAEAARKAAAGAHAKRFEEQGAAIVALTAHVRGATARADRTKWIIGLTFALLAALINQCADVAKVVLAPAPAVAPPPPPPAPQLDGGIAR